MTIRPRSGVTLKTRLRVQFGTVDSGFRGEVKVIVDHIDEPLDIGGLPRFIDGTFDKESRFCEVGTYIIRRGDRIAQAVIAPFETAHFVDSDKLEESIRSVYGFGSSGVRNEGDIID
jgi:dUTP pyrophosphatase